MSVFDTIKPSGGGSVFDTIASRKDEEEQDDPLKRRLEEIRARHLASGAIPQEDVLPEVGGSTAADLATGFGGALAETGKFLTNASALVGPAQIPFRQGMKNLDKLMGGAGEDPVNRVFDPAIEAGQEAEDRIRLRGADNPVAAGVLSSVPRLAEAVLPIPGLGAKKVTGVGSELIPKPPAFKGEELAEAPSRLATWLRRKLSSTGNLPEREFERLASVDHRVAEAKFRAQSLTKLLDEQLENYADDIGSSVEEVKRSADLALQGKEAPRLPDEIQQTIGAMRTDLDGLSGELLESGAVRPEMVETIKGNIGKYLHRSYRAFDDPKWAEEIKTTDSWKGAVDRLMAEDGLTKSEATAELNEFVTRLDRPVWLEREPIGDAAGILKRKKEIPEYLRAVLGEYNDPGVNYLRSVVNMRKRIEVHKVAKELRQQGLRSGLLAETKGGAGDPNQFRSVTLFEREGLDPAYALPAVADEMELLAPASAQGTNTLINALVKLNAPAKLAKTLGNPSSYMRNFISSGLLHFASGGKPWVGGRRAAKATMRGLLKRSNGKVAMIGSRAPSAADDGAAIFADALKHGVVGDSSRGQELKFWLENAPLLADLDRSPKVAAKFRAGLKKIGSKASDAWSAGDDFWKTMRWMDEIQNYRKVYEKRGVDITDTVMDEIKEKAAGIVRNTMPTYSRAPELVQELKAFPIAGSFPTFPSEVARNLKNTTKLALSEMRDPATRALGVRRMAQLAAAMAVPAGTSLATGFALFGQNPEEVAKDRQMATGLLPPWARSAEAPIVGKGDGSFSYIDMSYLSPFTQFTNPMMAFWLGNTPEEKLEESLKAAAEPYLGLEFGVVSSMESAMNYSIADQRPIGNGPDRAKHVLEAYEPGMSAQLRKIARAYSRDDQERLKREVGSLSGVRISTNKVVDSARYRAYDLDKSMSTARDRFYRKSGRHASGRSFDEAVRSLNEAEAEIGRELQQVIEGALHFGADWKDLREAMQVRGISYKNLDRARRGLPVELLSSKRISERRRELSSLSR